MCMIGSVNASEQHGVEGWRWFRVTGTGRLGSTFKHHVFPVRVNHTVPRPPTATATHESPDGMLYGFWTYSTRERAGAHSFSHRRNRRDFVLARVRLSGTVIKHEQGARGEHMEILSISPRPRVETWMKYMVKTDKKLAKEVAKTYGVRFQL